jgi:hypothetical protein
MNFAAWQGGGQNTRSLGLSPGQRDQAMSAWTMPKQQLLEFGKSMPQVPQYQPQQGADPRQLGARNAALVQQINDAGAAQQVGTYLGQGAPPADWGNMQLNQQQMLSNANQMVNQGYQNPFAMQPSQPAQSPGPQDNAAAIRGLLQGFNIPQNVMDQISGMFGGQQGTPPPPSRPMPTPMPTDAIPPPSRPPAGDNAGIRRKSIWDTMASPGPKPTTAAATADFMTANADAIKYRTLRTSDIDQLGLPSKEAQALRKQVQGKQASPSPNSGRIMTENAIASLAADPNLTPSEKANKFMAASKESLDNQTFKHSDIDLLGLSHREAQLLKNRASLHQRAVDRFQRAREASAMFPNYGLKQQDYAAAKRKYGLT